MAKVTDLLGQPHSGIVPMAVIGIVTDNVDPDELGRLQVKFPTLHDEPLSFWIRQASPNAGAIEDDAQSRRGMYALPEIDDEVLVIFMQGSQDVGVIIGQFWNGVQRPPREAWGYGDNGVPKPDTTAEGFERATSVHNEGSSDIEKNDRRFWKSRSGHLIVFDDTDGNETFQIWDHTRKLAFAFDGNQKLISLSNVAGDGAIEIRAAGDIHLEAGKNLYITTGENMDTLVHQSVNRQVDQNVTDNVNQNIQTTAGQSITTTASQNISMTASQNLSTSAGSATSMTSGNNFSISTGGVASVNGSMIKLN